jgi:hypothetical protein
VGGLSTSSQSQTVRLGLDSNSTRAYWGEDTFLPSKLGLDNAGFGNLRVGERDEIRFDTVAPSEETTTRVTVSPSGSCTSAGRSDGPVRERRDT